MCWCAGTASASRGFDLHFIDLDDVYAINVDTRKGAKLLEGFHHAFDALPSDMTRVNRRLSEKWQKFAYRLDFDIYMLPELLEKSYDSDLWNELGEICLACGMCTQVCPTCYCYGIEEEVDLTFTQATKRRTLYSCNLLDFAMVAGGHNFRPEAHVRLKYRYYHQFKGFVEAFNQSLCVGCNRCGVACLAGINPKDVIDDLIETERL